MNSLNNSFSISSNLHELDQMYIKLLERVLSKLKRFKSDLTTEQNKTVVCAPKVVPEGRKKTIFINFRELCDNMKRNYDHVSKFISNELGANVSLDTNMCMIVKGRFLAKTFENVIRRYITEYVLCHLCKSSETLIHKDHTNRLVCIKCNNCGASKSVPEIKEVFRARTTSRRLE